MSTRIGRVWLVSVMGILCVGAGTGAAEPERQAFAIRGTLPWHNFLSGPSAWNEKDYERYLDGLRDRGLNFVGFHCYTGGAERYAPYVEPMIRIEYRNVVPLAGFDTSVTARWGYRQLKAADFAYDAGKALELPPGADAFGADCAVLARDNEDRYRRAQALMRRVLEMAHERGIQMAMGFEFGIHPPEFASIMPPDAWIRGAMLPDPTHAASIEILHATIDDILAKYPGIDWIWLWLHEHTMFVGQPRLSGSFQAVYEKEASLFDDDSRFTGVWSLAYIREACSYIHQKAPNVKVAIGGWGGGTQLPGILRGLNRALPADVVFTCLNPNQGWEPQPAFLAEIAKDRSVWAIPWLEGDRQLWHLQPRVTLMREQVKLAADQRLAGVVAIHWRTEETRLNLEVFARFARRPGDGATVEDLYRQDCGRQFGDRAGSELAPILARMDREGAFNPPDSPEYFPYEPRWGRVQEKVRARFGDLLATVERLGVEATEPDHRTNLGWLAANLKFTLLLDEVGRRMEPAYNLKIQRLTGRIPLDQWDSRRSAAMAELQAAPVRELMQTYAHRVRSRGEQGVLSALNQKLWLQYKELADYLGDR